MQITHAPSEYIVIYKNLNCKASKDDLIDIYVNSDGELYYRDKYDYALIGDSHIKCNYIGLNDKDGNMVYEGDLFSYGGDGLWFVNWDKYYCKYILTSIIDIKNCTAIEFVQNNIKIGNIYLNPELVKNL